ncbi:MAG: O-antigen ligase family protein [Bdellovibrionota bacterium]
MIIVFVLMMTSLLISQSFMDLMSFVVILVSLWAWKQDTLIEGRRFQLSRIGLEKLWITWILVFAIGLALAPYTAKELSVNSSPFLRRLAYLTELKWIINFYFFIWFFEWLRPWNFLEKKKANPWTWIWGALLITSIYGLIGWIFDFDLIKQLPLSDHDRVGGLFDDPMTFAHVYSLFFILAFFVSLQKYLGQKKDWLLIFAIACSGLAVFLSMTRGVWVGIFIAFLISLFLYRRKFGVIFLASSGGLFVLLFSLWFKFQERVLFAFNAANNYDSERIWLWTANWKIFLDHPVFGIGYGMYKWRLREYFDLIGAPIEQFQSHAHNQYLHFLAGTGILGLLCFLFFAGFNLWQSWKLILFTSSRTIFIKGLAYGLMAAQISFLIAGATESNFERAKVRWTYLIFAALATAAVRTMKVNAGQATTR